MTELAVSVRTAKIEDADAIGIVDAASHHAAYSPIFGPSYAARVSPSERSQHWRQILGEQSAGAKWVLVACIQGRVVGYARLTASRDADASQHVGEVGALYVHPDWWRRGIGRRLLDTSLELLQGQGFSTVTLWALEENVHARAFYEAEGWQDDGGRQKLDMELPGNLTEVRYRKVIERPQP